MGGSCEKETKKSVEETEWDDNEIVDKTTSDKMGRNDIQTPSWMQTTATIPSHCSSLKPEKIKVPFPGSDTKWVYVIRNVLTKSECESLIKLSETAGYIDALVNIGGGYQQKLSSVRNCKRVMMDNKEMTNHLWERLKSFIPNVFMNRNKISFNERLRFLRYHKGEYFAPHHDGIYIRDDKSEMSLISVLIYLNDDYKGGTTNFLNYNDEKQKFAPKITQGMVLMFEHKIYHEGAMLLKGTKYIIRTDVMFSYDEVDDEEKDMDEIEDAYKPPVDLMEKFMENVNKFEASDGEEEDDDDEPMPKLFDIPSNEDDPKKEES